MSIEKKDIDKILSLDKASFEEKLHGAIKAAGIDKKFESAILSDSDRIMKTIKNMNQKDIDKLSEIIKKNNLGQLENIIKSELNK